MRVELDANRMDIPEREEKMRQVAEEMEIIVNSKLFMHRVLTMPNESKIGERSKWKDVHNIEIYNRIMSGSDMFSDFHDNVMDIFVDDYYSFKKVIGYTTYNSKWIYVNTKYFDARENILVGSNIIHEYGHLVGFSHDFWNTADRSNSICYQLNRIYEECHREIIKDLPSLIKVYVGRSWWGRKVYEWRSSEDDRRE